MGPVPSSRIESGRGVQSLRRDAARVAAGEAHEPAASRRRRRRLDASHQLPRDRQGLAESHHGARSRQRARPAAAGSQPPAPGGGLRGGVSGLRPRGRRGEPPPADAGPDPAPPRQGAGGRRDADVGHGRHESGGSPGVRTVPARRRRSDRRLQRRPRPLPPGRGATVRGQLGGGGQRGPRADRARGLARDGPPRSRGPAARPGGLPGPARPAPRRRRTGRRGGLPAAPPEARRSRAPPVHDDHHPRHPVDVGAQELRIEAYYPADAATEEWLDEQAARDAKPR